MPPRPSSAPRSGTTRPALWRVIEIHQILRQGHFPNCSSLAQAIEVTPKTIQRDLNFIRHQLGLPLAYDPIQHGFTYTQPVQDFPLLHLSRRDLVALFLARQALAPLRGTRLEPILADSFRHLAAACPGEVSLPWEDLESAFSVKAAGAMTSDLSHLSDLLDAVMHRQVVSFLYRKLGSTTPERRQVHPHHLGQVEQGWYLLAFDPQRQAIRTFALPRISQLRLLKSTFLPQPNFNAATYLSGGFGVWSYPDHSAQNFEVSIHFHGWAARIVAERTWHPSQRILPLDPAGHAIEFRATLFGLEEITRWVLSWGRKAHVLAPPELQDRLRAEATAILANHPPKPTPNQS